MDLLGPVSGKISNTPYLLTVMDLFSRYAMAIPLENKKGETVATAFLKEWIQGCGGVPESILADQGKEFVSKTTRSVVYLSPFMFMAT